MIIRKPHIWTVEEIKNLPEFGEKMGWFYGLVRTPEGSVKFSEVLPGYGYTTPFLTINPVWWYRMVRDLLTYRP
jgi:hypothetical protein